MQSNMNINMNALQAVIDNYGFTHIDQPAAVPLEAQILSGYQKAAFILSGWDRDAVAKGAFKTPSPAPLPKARAPKVAPLGTMASTGNLIAKIDYALVASSTFAGIQACLRINDVEDGMLPTVEVNQKGLLQHSRRGFSKVGPYVEVTIEANSRIGQVKAHQIMGDGLVISDLAGTKWEGVLWVMSAVEDRKDSICVIMTPGRSIPNFWKLAGYKCKGNPKTILKRLRRIMSDSKIEFVGVLASTFAGVYHCEFGDLVYQQHPCKDSVYMIHTVIIEGKSFVLNTPIEFVVGHLAMNDSDTYRKILGIGDGSHPFAPAHINRIIWFSTPRVKSPTSVRRSPSASIATCIGRGLPAPIPKASTTSAMAVSASCPRSARNTSPAAPRRSATTRRWTLCSRIRPTSWTTRIPWTPLSPSIRARPLLARPPGYWLPTWPCPSRASMLFRPLAKRSS